MSSGSNNISANHKTKIHVLSHTHWDREWYQDFQGYRQRLVFQMDELLNLLERDKSFRCFHLDGQTCCLFDYLEIRPENEQRLRRQLADGRIVIGPWFVMPDELLLSGESLVRNLALGHKVCAGFGVNPMQIGYVTDIFGHCSQFPQILDGFGIDSAMLHRGIPADDDETTEMFWVGADGTEVLLIRIFPDTGYQDFLQRRDVDDDALLEYESRKRELSATGITFAMDGNDHQPARADTAQKIEHFNSVFKESYCVHSSMDDFLSELKSALTDEIKAGLKRFYGELRSPEKKGIYGDVFNGIASGRVNLKKENDDLEYLLSRNADQLNAWSHLCGGDDQRAFLDHAWRYLLLNHPHDSIVGCSIDQVHKDMLYRFDQSRSLAVNSIWESIQSIDEAIDTTVFGEKSRVVTIHNEASTDLGPISRFTFDVFTEDDRKHRAKGTVPALFDENGNAVKLAVEMIEHKKCREPLVRKVKGEICHYLEAPDVMTERERYHVVAATTVPAFGYKSFGIGFITIDQARELALPANVQESALDRDSHVIENEFIKLKVNPDATIDLTDKATNRCFKNIHQLEDCGDEGHGWNHIYPENDLVLNSTTPGAISNLRITAKEMDGLSASITVSYNMAVPEGLTSDRKSRLKRKVKIPVQTEFTLDAGSRRVDCKTEITNKVGCHRMRLLFPTQIDTYTWFGDTAFDIVERKIKLIDTTGWLEQAREESPIKNFVAAAPKNGCGLGVITHGLCEAAVRDNESRDIALTLFRSYTGVLYGTWSSDSQMMGKQVSKYHILPFDSTNGFVPFECMMEAEKTKIKPYAFTEYATSGKLPHTGRFMKIGGKAVVSTIKTSDDGSGLILRIFNPEPVTNQIEVELFSPIQEAWLCDLNENHIEKLKHDGSNIQLDILPKKVLSVYLRSN